MIKDQDILKWIEEAADESSERGESRIASIQLLIIRLALSHKGPSDEMTKSVEISINSFDRQNLYRILRDLQRKQWINFVKPDGSPLDASESITVEAQMESENALGFVCTTPKGDQELLRLKKLTQLMSDNSSPHQ